MPCPQTSQGDPLRWVFRRRKSCRTVPHYITSNAFIADAYAKVVLGYLRDCAAAVDAAEPIYLVDLGAGIGRFGFHFITCLLARLAMSPFSGLSVKYILTDLVAANVDYYLSHPRLQPLIEAGRLDCASFDVEADGELRLRSSGARLAPGSVRNPMVFIANYVFDSVPVDAFRIIDGQLHESLVTLRAPGPLASPDDPSLLRSITLEYEYRKVTLPYYEDASWDQTLSYYQRTERNCGVLFPCATLACIARLRALAGGRLLLLSADKGFHRQEDLDRTDPGLALHGSFSAMVNYHAIAQWVRAQGEVVLHSAHCHSSLSIQAFAFGLRDATETRLAFADSLASAGPDDLFSIKKALDYRFDTLNAEQLLALIRLCHWDSKIFLGCIPALKSRLAEAGLTDGLRADLLSAIDAAQDHYFPIGDEQDLAAALRDLRKDLDHPPGLRPDARLYGHRFAQLQVLPRGAPNQSQ